MIDNLEFAQFKAQWIKDLFPELNKTGIEIADIGCGDGLMTYYIQEVFYEAHIVGIDTENIIEKAKKSFSELHFLSSEKIAQKKQLFDVLIFSLVLHHINSEGQKKALFYWQQFLKPQGAIIIIELNSWAPKYWFCTIVDICDNALSWIYPQKVLHKRYKSYYSLFFPKILSMFMPCEKYIQKVPLGSLAIYRTNK